MQDSHSRQTTIRLGTHGENYGNWMSNPVFYMVGGLLALAVALAVLSFTVFHLTMLGVIFIIAAIILLSLIHISLLSLLWGIIFSSMAYEFSGKDMVWTYVVLALGTIAVFALHLRRVPFLKIIIGLVYTYVGLVLFLVGVNVGFSSLGTILGAQLAIQSPWLLVPIAMVMGWFIISAEPAVHVLNKQVEDCLLYTSRCV